MMRVSPAFGKKVILLLPPVKRSTLILAALDTNFMLLILGVCGMVLYRNPVTVFLVHPDLVAMAMILPLFLALGNLYDLNRPWWTPSHIAQAVVTVLVVFLAFGAYHRFADRVNDFNLAFIFVGASVAAEVVLVRSWGAVRAQRGRVRRNTLVVGSGWAGRQVIDTILCEPGLRLNAVGTVDDDPKLRNYVYRGVRVLGTRQQLREILERQKVDLIVDTISLPRGEVAGFLPDSGSGRIEVVDMPRFFERSTGQVPIKNVKGSWSLFSDGFNIPERWLTLRFKRIIDIIASASGLLVSLPLTVVVALLIKIDTPGPVFYRQTRVGQNENTFRLLKFRSMRTDSRGGGAPIQKEWVYRSVTRVGRWLRMTRVDEIPKLINVLRGDMSFVGPRSEKPFFVEKLKAEIPFYVYRFRVKPGVTGWAQVRSSFGVSSDKAVEKLGYDLYYIKKMSWLLDASIIMKTFKIVLSGKVASWKP
jgi:exopolysaccharide biosynthesis polyprenyl glycosylphosphotransferase